MENTKTIKKYLILSGYPSHEMWGRYETSGKEKAYELFEKQKDYDICSNEGEKWDDDHWWVELEEETTPLDEDGDPIECRAEYETIEMFDVTQYLKDEEERKEKEKEEEALSYLKESSFEEVARIATKYRRIHELGCKESFTEEEKRFFYVASEDGRCLGCDNVDGGCYFDSYDSFEALKEDCIFRLS